MKNRIFKFNWLPPRPAAGQESLAAKTELGRRKNYYLEVFLIAFLISMSFLLPYMILDKGLFLFFGDYDVQQVPFYILAHRAVTTGNVFWSWTTDLGANFVGSYAFYLLGSPFFWLTTPLPAWLVPYTLGPLLALKISMAALTSYAYIRRFVRTPEIACLGALLYAFSSYSVYNIFFNHFHEPMCFFPLILIGIEEFMKNDRRGLFLATVALNAFVNYIFFVSEVVFVVLYWVIRMASGAWKLNFKKFLSLALEAALGVGISCVLLVPAVAAITGNWRTGQHLQGWNLLLYDNVQRIPDILHSLFFPQDLPSRPNFFPDADNKWASMAAWLPLFSMSGVIAFCHAKRAHWLRRILGVCLVMALIPGLNALYILLNTDYYARWFYMPVLLMALATAISLEDPSIDLKHGLFWTAVITAGFTAAIGLVPKIENGKFVQLGLEEYPLNFWIFVLVVVFGLLLTFIIYELHGNNRVALANSATIALTVVVCIYANFFIATGKSYGYSGDWYKSVALEGGSSIGLASSSFYRVDVLDGMDNQTMAWNLPDINAFQSVVPSSIMDFYRSMGISRDVGSRPDLSYVGLRPLLSVKYLLDADNRTSLSEPGWLPYSEKLGFKIWKNLDYIPMGFTYASYITQQQYDVSMHKDRLLLKGLLLSNAQIQKYSDILTSLPATLAGDYSDIAYTNDCATRNLQTCSSFVTSGSGFTAKITLKSENLVFFSVPYDSGWTAAVNGKPATIEKVNVGFMAVLCPAGTSSIRFSYYTPGLNMGAALSGASILLAAVYLVAGHLLRRRKRRQLAGILPAQKELADDE